jgi:hypothetical protein
MRSQNFIPRSLKKSRYYVRFYYKNELFFPYEKVGHILGASHDPNTQKDGGATEDDIGYGVGYLIPGTNKYTIMA